MPLAVGDPAPDVTLTTDGGGTLAPQALRGRKVVLYFYPKDNTSGCTAEACDFRDLRPRFEAAGAAVIGVSKDVVASHDRFKAKYGLAFPLLSDAEGKVCEAYGAWVKKSLYGRLYMGIERSTFLIDEAGIIRGIWRRVKVKDHAATVLAAVKG